MIRDLLKHSVLVGLGALSLTKEKADQLMDELVKKGEMTREEARQFLDDVVAKAQREKESLGRIIRDEIERWRKDKALATKSDLERIEAELKELKSMLQAQRSAGDAGDHPPESGT